MVSQDSFTLLVGPVDHRKSLIIDIPKTSSRSILFSIFEYDDAEIINNSKNYDVFVEDLEEGKEKEVVLYGERVEINNSNHPCPPMEYRIRIYDKTSSKSRIFLYRVLHTKVTSQSQYKSMVSAIGQYDENLLYEEDPKFLSGKRIYNAGRRNLQALIGQLMEDRLFINQSLYIIRNNPVLADRRVVVKTTVPKRQTSRSISRSIRSPKEDIYYSSQMTQSADVPLNEYLVFMLRFSLLRLDELIKESKNAIIKNRQRIAKILENSPNPEKRKQHTQYQIDSYQNRVDRLSLFLEYSSTITYSINNLLNSSDFVGINPRSNRDMVIIYHPYYMNIERRLYLPLLQGFTFSFASTYSSILSSPIKQTSKLFEAYCLLSLDSAVREMGFVSQSDEFDYEHITRSFVRDQYQIDLMYEINAKDVSLAVKDDVYYLNENTKHISPDFYLILKDNNVPICFLIFDAKCRRPERVQKDILEGKYQATVRDYLSLRYSTDDNPFFLPKVADSLWLLFPNDGLNEKYSKVNKLEYQIVKLSLDGDEGDFAIELGNYLSRYLY